MNRDIPRIILGRTGIEVTRLGTGGAYCKEADGYRAALDCGVNYMDTAHTYGEDEKIIGEAIRGRRDDLILATKSNKRDAEEARKDLETSLRLLGTDHVDIWQLHGLQTPEERDRALGPGGAMEAALKAREQGLIRFIGVTGHDWDQLAIALATGLFDTVLCWYNCGMKEAESTVFPQALAHNVGVVIMSASRLDRLFGGPDAPAEEDFYRYVLTNPAVHVTLMGLRNVARFQRISSALAVRSTLTPEEAANLERYGAWMRAAGKLEKGG